MPQKHWSRPERAERTSLSLGDVEAISKSVVEKMMEPPNTVSVVLVRPDRTKFVTELDGIPRPGDHLWMPLRRNGKPKRWLVASVEWFVEWPLRNVEVHLVKAPLEGTATQARTPTSKQH